MFRGLVSDVTLHEDLMPLADKLVVYKDSTITGVNKNTIVVGSTGCGKTTSITEPDLLHNFHHSEVVPVSKQLIVKKYIKEMRKRGFKVEVINYLNADEGTVGYDPMDYVNSAEDAIELASQFMASEYNNKQDPFWDNTAESVIAAIIMLVKINADYAKVKPKFEDVIALIQKFKYERVSAANSDADIFRVNIMYMFEEAENVMPDNSAMEMISSVAELPERTAMCVYTTIKSAVDKVLSENIQRMVSMEKKIDFERLGDEKTILFVVTNPFNTTCGKFNNIMYSQMFRCLFEKAEKSDEGHLDVPVHVICDDFACSGKIQNFENYISIFRQAGISVTILLQSESQLTSLYDQHAATTILNNSDTYVFMGSMDDATVRSISKKVNMPYDKVMHMPLEHVIVIRRGTEPYVGRRYQLYDDPMYVNMNKRRR